jgi:hypothetical protein
LQTNNDIPFVNTAALIPPGPTSASDSISPTTSPAGSTPPTGSVALDSSTGSTSTGSTFTGSTSTGSTSTGSTSTGSTSSVSPPEDPTPATYGNCGEIDDASIPLIAQSSYNSIFQNEHPSYYTHEIAITNIFRGDSNFGTINNPDVLKSQIEEYLYTLKLE